jgi:short-subunit dehydrogenase
MRKLIVVTGGTKGIGKSIILEFAKNNFDVVTCSRKQQELESLENELLVKFPELKFYHQAADLSDKGQVISFANYIRGLGRQVNILVNNAGLYVPGQVHNEPEGNLEFMINTNLYSAYNLTRQLIQMMIDEREGHIFNICSTASITPYVNGGSYCISKFAMLGMSKVLREEMKPHNVRVTSIMPGATLTASWDGVELPSSRFMKPEDVAQVVWTAFNLSGNSVIEEILMRPQLGDLG